jgi:hypothetical protein
MAALSPLAAGQWGMVTAAQARELGISRSTSTVWSTMARLSGSRLRPGVPPDWKPARSRPR